MGVGALYCQYYVDVRQRCCYNYKNKYSFEPVVLDYEVVAVCERSVANLCD